MKYKVTYIPTHGTPAVTEVIEADSKEEAELKVPKYFSDRAILSVKQIIPD